MTTPRSSITGPAGDRLTRLFEATATLSEDERRTVEHALIGLMAAECDDDQWDRALEIGRDFVRRARRARRAAQRRARERADQ